MNVNKTAGAIAAAMVALTIPETALADDSIDLYAGVHGEYLWGEPTLSPDPSFLSRRDFSGEMAGVTLGINHTMGDFLIGAETDLAFGNADGHATDQLGFEGIFVDLDWLATFRARAGYKVNNVLLFGTGGLALGGLEAVEVNPNTFLFDKTAMGYTVGFGAEMNVSERLSIKGEFLYVDFGKEKFPPVFAYGASSAGVETSLVRLGVNLHL